MADILLQVILQDVDEAALLLYAVLMHGFEDLGRNK